jgi:Cytochrome oxidase assembly protein
MTGSFVSPELTPPAARAAAANLPYWLLLCCAMIFAMVVLGGITRLTLSGLSQEARYEADAWGNRSGPFSRADDAQPFSRSRARGCISIGHRRLWIGCRSDDTDTFGLKLRAQDVQQIARAEDFYCLCPVRAYLGHQPQASAYDLWLHPRRSSAAVMRRWSAVPILGRSNALSCPAGSAT